MKELLIFSKKKLGVKIPFLILGFLFFWPFSVKAVCPLCGIIAVGGLGLSRWLGIDDTISGTWIGGLVVSLILWLLDFLDKKQIDFKFKKTIVWFSFYILIIAPFYFAGILGHPENRIWGIDKLLTGIFLGSLVFYLGSRLHLFLKKESQGKSFFPFQKVVIPILFLFILSFIFYFLTS